MKRYSRKGKAILKTNKLIVIAKYLNSNLLESNCIDFTKLLLNRLF